MKAVATHSRSRFQSPIARWMCAFAIGLAGTLSTAIASPSDGPQVEVSGATVPNFDSASGPARASRLAIVLMPEHHSKSSIGLTFGVTSVAAPVAGFAAAAASLPLVDFGVHWRYTFDSSYRFDVTAYRRVQNADAISLIESRDPSYGARIEMGFGSKTAAKGKGFVADRGFVGFQLEGGGRVTFKRTHGVPMLYYRNSFY